MARAFWKGVISFGMVVIPVKMYVATETQALSFHLLHKKCLTRPKQVLHCEQDNEYFSNKDTVRGYEYTKGQYLVMSDEDFDRVPVNTAHSVRILGFVEAKEIDPIYYHSSHYLEPEELGTKPFSLLCEVLLKTQRVGIAKVTFQRREHLCCLRPLENILALHTMYYPGEIISRKDLTAPEQKVSAEELEMATSLVKMMVMSFKPGDYHDEYHDALKKLIEAKLKGVEIKVPKVPKIEVVDLMSALKASLETAKKGREPVGARK